MTAGLQGLSERKSLYSLVLVFMLVYVVEVYFFTGKVDDVSVPFVEQHHKPCNASAYRILRAPSISLAKPDSQFDLILREMLLVFSYPVTQHQVIFVHRNNNALLSD